MLGQQRDVLVAAIVVVMPRVLDFENLVESVRPGTWAAVVRLTATHANAVAAIVDAADAQGWIRDLVARLATTFAERPDFAVVLAAIDRDTIVETTPNPVEEVLLRGDRPFVNRQRLRNQLLTLIDPKGSGVLLVDGAPQTGKSYSFYLINHVARSRGFEVNKFPMTRLPKPDELADDILRRIGASQPLAPQGPESAERWAEKLADLIALEILRRATPRVFVFDDFADTPLPDGTASLIVRLARYIDEELEKLLRVVLVRFGGELPHEIDGVALRDDITPFSTTDMVAMVMKVARARAWAVTDAVIASRIQQFDPQGHAPLRDRFTFLRGLLQELAGAAAPGGGP
jgi:hypothetical protein